MCLSRRTNEKVNWQATEGEKIFSNHTSDKGLMSRVWRKLIELSIKTIQSKDGQKTPHERRLRMSNKHKKKCSTSLVIREMLLETMSYYHLPTRMAKVKSRVSEYVEHPELSYIIGESVKQAFWKRA